MSVNINPYLCAKKKKEKRKKYIYCGKGVMWNINHFNELCYKNKITWNSINNLFK